MEQRNAVNFIEDHKEILKEFNRKINQIDTLDFKEDDIELEVKARRHARDIVYEWINEIMGVAKGEMTKFKDEEEEDLFKEYTEDKVEPQY